jgi:SAM-dependent methyltransferase
MLRSCPGIGYDPAAMASSGDILGRIMAFVKRAFFAVTRRIARRFERHVSGPIEDRRMGIATNHLVESDELGYTEEQTLPYEPTRWRAFRRAFPRGSVSKDDVFVDLGSGLGRAVLAGSELPFRRVIGVELSPELHAAALANLAKAQIKRRDVVEFVCADVREYQVPDDVTVVYLGNPFRGEIFGAAVAQILASHDRAPRRMRIVYFYPTEQEQLEATGRVRLLSESKENWMRGVPQRTETLIYEVLPRPR